ncbi:tetratricopeptide repeat protein 25-like isoform X4 [Pomacea canaliculata]|uniref:tetratricopeptide repeat protein 25-like isoform X4 n=1 Tax=Pomacea canaliculata TaxID=400727 RepID=UPI000D73ADC6|nr:tetratricopeptide repeat protein 25-like isoform X4 [Pomacea canaliculata]
MPKGRGRKDSDSDVASEEQSTVGTFETLRDEGEHFVHVKQYQKAIESFSKALEMKPGDKTCLVTRSKCYLMLGNSQAALADAEAALDQDEEGKKDIRERLEDQWLALCMKAEALYQKGDFETALVYYHRGNKLRPELQEFRLGIQKSQEAINNSIGTPDAVNLEASGDLSFFFKQEEKQKQQQQKGYSKPQTQKREEKKERGKPQGTGSSKTTKELLGELYKDRAYLDKLYDSLVSNNTDTDEYIKGRAVDGLEYLNTRADFWRQQKPMYARKRDRQRKQMKNGKENDPMEYILEQLEEIDEAQAKGEYEKSLKKSQNTLKKIDSWGNDRVKNKPALVANLYSCMGNANLELGKFKEALEHHKKDLSIGEDENIEEAVSRALDNLGRTKARMGKYEDAIEIWEKKVPKSKSALERTWLYHEIGRCYLELGRYGDAKDYGEKSFSAAKEADDHGWQLHASVLVAQAEVKCEKLEAAVDSFERAKEIAEELKDHSAEMAIKKALEEVKSRIVEGERSKTKVDDDADDDDRRSIKSDGSGGSQKRGQELKKGDEDRDGDPGEKDAKDKANEEMRDNKNEEELEDAHHEQAAKEETDAPTMQAEDNTGVSRERSSENTGCCSTVLFKQTSPSHPLAANHLHIPEEGIVFYVFFKHAKITLKDLCLSLRFSVYAYPLCINSAKIITVCD